MFFFFAVIFALHFDSGHSKDDHSLSCPLSNVDCAALFKSKARNCCKTLCLPLLIEIGKLYTNRQCHFSGVQFVQQFGNKTGQPNVMLYLPAAVGIGNRIAELVASLSTRAIAAALRSRSVVTVGSSVRPSLCAAYSLRWPEITSYSSAAPIFRTSNGDRTPFSRMLSHRNCISTLSCTLYGLSSNGRIFNQLQPLPSKTDKTFLEIFMNANLSSKNRSVQPEIQLCAPVCFDGANIAFFA